ncbi:MAG: hypothetical protein AMXMBFR61_01370 [Fimbriimonadales bacterium]
MPCFDKLSMTVLGGGLRDDVAACFDSHRARRAAGNFIVSTMLTPARCRDSDGGWSVGPAQGSRRDMRLVVHHGHVL